MTHYIPSGERARFLEEVDEEITAALLDGDPDLAAALSLDASMAVLGVGVEPTAITRALGRRLEQMDEVRLRRVAAIIDERHERRSARPHQAAQA